MPKLKGAAFETAIIERRRRRESSVEEALIEMCLAGVSVRRVEDITEALRGSKASPSTISELNKKAHGNIESWRNRPLEGTECPYVYVDGIYLKRNWGGSYENVSILVAIGVDSKGFREVLGSAEGTKEDKASWLSFFQWLKGRGLSGAKLTTGDKCLGMLEAAVEVFPESKCQRCFVRFYRNVFSVAPRGKTVLAAKKAQDSIEETLTHTYFPYEHWLKIRTNNAIERVNREIRRQTQAVGCFPDGNSALMLACARLRHVANSQWGNRKHMSMKHLRAVSAA
jgi:transposase-like protein